MRAAEFVARQQARSAHGAVATDPQPDSFPVMEPDVAPAVQAISHIEERDVTFQSLIELILKDRWRLYRILRVTGVQATLLPRLLAISLAGFVLFGVAMSLVLTVAGRWPSLTSIAVWLESSAGFPLTFNVIQSPWGYLAAWVNGEVLVLVAAYAVGLVAASGVCLPSLYFYCLLAGVRMTMLEIVVHAVKSKAIAAVALVGILPIYVAIAMGVVIFGGGELLLGVTLLMGLALPFVAGIWGTVSLYQGLSLLCDSMPADRAQRRECFLRRLVFSWSACYSAVMPVMIYSIWEVFSRA